MTKIYYFPHTLPIKDELMKERRVFEIAYAKIVPKIDMLLIYQSFIIDL